MEDVDPDCKEWQDHEKENAILSIKGFEDLIDESEVILTIQFSLDIKKNTTQKCQFSSRSLMRIVQPSLARETTALYSGNFFS